MSMLSLPTELIPIRDQIIHHVVEATPYPETLSALVGWFETDGWDLLVGAWSDERVILKLYEFAEYKFNDSELCDYEDPRDVITDELRLTFAYKRIAEEFNSGDGSTCPSVHTVELRNDNGDTAILGWLVEIHGQAGHYPNFWGTYSNKEKFYQELRNTEHLFLEDDKEVNDKKILELWQR